MMDLEAALARARHELEVTPEAWEPRARHGALLLALGRPEEGLADLERAALLAPQQSAIHNNLGAAKRALGNNTAAIGHFENAIAIDPSNRDARQNAARTLATLAAERFENNAPVEAAQLYRKALSYDPDLASAWVYLGVALYEQGEIEAGNSAVQRAIDLAPDTVEPYRILADREPSRITATHVARLEELLRTGIDDRLAADAHAALSRAFQKTDLHRSFTHLVAANSLRREFEDYDESATVSSFEEIARVFTPEMIAASRGDGRISDVPIFIVGMPRSGTTLVEQIIASHPEVHGGGELIELEEAVRAIGFGSGPRIYAIGDRYVGNTKALAPLAKRITDKMPLNFRYAGLIHLALPLARMIHVRRDPLDTALSCFEQQFFQDALPWSYDLAELGRFMRGYLQLMEHWRTVLPPGAMLEVNYEDVVNDIETFARKLIAYVGLEWDDRCLRFYETYRSIRTASVAQVRKPIYSSSVGRAKAYGDLLKPFTDALYD